MRHTFSSSSHQLANVHRPLRMAQFIWSTIIFLPLLGYLSRAQDFRTSLVGRALRKESGYGRPVLAMANSPRCTFNGKPIEDGKTVTSPEPCLNCTCSKGILLCYLHTCNSIAPAPGCQIVKKPNTCCPQLECDGPLTYHDYRTERTSEPSNKLRVRQEDNHFFGLYGMDARTDRSAESTHPTRRAGVKGHRPNFSSILKGISSQKRSDTYGQSLYEQEEDIEDDELSPDNNTAGYCFSRGYKYTEGMAMLSPTKCEYCYCIGGQQMCVRPKCHLSIEGCVPRYQSGYTCCPSHYHCEAASGESTLGDEENPETESDSETTKKIKVTSCNVEGYDFDVGVAVPSNGHCQTCYCTQAGVVCRRLECSPTIPGCTPVIPEGHCCPTQYKCDQKNVNSSHVPVPHSTDNYDVTVISPIDSEGASSQSYPRTSSQSRTEVPDLYTETAENSPTTYIEDTETASETSSEKQKITVELPSESDLESISVIPEENIAVLILTTDKEDDEGKATSAEITSHTSTREEITTKLVAATVVNAKRKSKPTKSSTINDKIQNLTRFTTLGGKTNPSLITKSRDGTTELETDSTTNEKDTYAYDYEEMYDEGSPDLSETFSPFLDYSTTAFEETEAPGSSQERSPISNKRHKIKQKKPHATTTYHHLPTTKVDLISTRNNELFTHNTKETDFTQDESTYSTLDRSDTDETISEEPSEYTIYSSSRTRNPDTTTNLGTRITMPHSLQKIKKRRPGIVTKHKTSPFGNQSTRPIQVVTGSGLTLADIFNMQTAPIDTTTERKTFVPYAAETNTQTYSPYTRPPHVHKKKGSHSRRQPESLSQTTIIRKATKPSPQGIAEFLTTVTQIQMTQTPASSTEIDDPTTKKLSGDSSVSRETLPPIVLAAPKLIMEVATPESTQDTTETKSTNEATNPSSPIFNIQPEIIFSNHGPSQNRKKPFHFSRPTREPEIPLIINNHKRTSTRQRPPIFRPAPTPPSEGSTFVEISNHRPTNSFHRPASKFPPFPHTANRPDGNYHRDSHPRDSHPKLHRIDSEIPGEWTDDYEEYYYNTDHDHSTLTKIFNNIQPHQSTLVKGETTDIDKFFPGSIITMTSGNVNDLSAETVTPAYNEDSTAEIKLKANDSKIFVSETSEKDTNGHKLSENSEDKATTDPVATTETPTQPVSKTTYYLPTITTTNPEDTTKSFSGYVRNKYKGTSIHLHDSEAKFFRADEDAESKRRESDYRLIELGKKPDETFISYTERLTQNRPTLTTEAPVQPTNDQDEPQEITDVCFVDGRYYNSGETITKSNPCEMCRCFYGHPLCQVQQCPPPPDPTCALDYLPGYCCPRVTCGLETDPDQPPGIVSLPEPTSQEIRRSDTDNQWKPLPHGPLLRTTESTFKVETTTAQPITNSFVTAKTQTEKSPEVNNIYDWTEDSKILVTEQNTEQPAVVTTVITTTERQTTTEEPTTTFRTTEQPTTAVIFYRDTVPPTTETPLPTESTDATEDITTFPPSITTVVIPTTENNKMVDVTTVSKPLAPIFDRYAEENKGQQNKSEIHDNSSGVRKILYDLITLPSSKVELSLSDTSNISTVLPVIFTMPTTVPSVEESGTVTMNSADIGVVTELGGNLKVSGCNVYGKYYKINDKVTALSKPCSECICSAEGIACNPTC